MFLLGEAELMIRVGLACVLGWLIGNERKNRNKSAGTRTHAIVALGAALAMVVSKYGFQDIPDYDAARVAAQVVSGVGFLGAGIIFVRNNLVNGLTTAAGLWATASVGLAMGSGLYVIGIASALVLILMQEITHKIAYFAKVASGGMIHMTLVQETDAVKNMRNFLESFKIDVVSVKINKNKKEEIKLEFEVVYPPGFDKAGLFSKLAEKSGVIMISE
ncbi:MgtC/SapB family protein [bacterium D16-54]|nr:MgtC/SapB family protein [bacterium D16-54]RKJ15221.1 MgtC/SapB family protein [bacterium D16-56]